MSVAPSPQPDSTSSTGGRNARDPSTTASPAQFLLELNELLAAAADGRDNRADAVRRIQKYFAADAVWLAPFDSLTRVFEVGVRLRAYDWPELSMQQCIDAGQQIQHYPLLLVPLTNNQQTSGGVLALVRRAGAFITREQRLLRRIGALLAREQQIRRQYLLLRVLDRTNRRERPIDVYEFLLDELRRFIRYDHSAAILVLDSENNQLIVRQELVVTTDGGDRLPVPRHVDLPPDGALSLSHPHGPLAFWRQSPGAAWQHAGDDVSYVPALAYGEAPWHPLGTEEFSPPVHETSPESAILAFPLVYHGTVWGYLKLATRTAHPPILSGDDWQLLDLMTSRLALTLYQSNWHYRQQVELSAVRAVGQMTIQPVSLEEVCRAVLDSALRTLNLRVGAVSTPLRLIDGWPVRVESPRGEFVTQVMAPLEQQAWLTRAAVIENDQPLMQSAGVGLALRAALVVPITYEDEVIGSISVQSTLAGRFTKRESDFLQTLANQAALALKTAQLYEQLQQETRERQARLALLHELSRELNQLQEVDAILQRAVDTARQRLQSETASVFLLHDGSYRIRRSAGQDEAAFHNETYRLGEGLTGLAATLPAPAAATGCPFDVHPGHEPHTCTFVPPVASATAGSNFGSALVCNHVETCNSVVDTHRQRYQRLLVSHQVCHLIAVPLNEASHTFGILRVVNKLNPDQTVSAAGFTEDDRDLLSTIASQVATALSNLRQTQRLTSIFDINAILTDQYSGQLIGDRIAEIMTGETMGYNACMLHQRAGKSLILTSFHARPAIAAPDLDLALGDSITGQVAESGQPRQVIEIAAEHQFKYRAWAAEHGYQSMLCVPLRAGDRVIGTLSVYTTYRYHFNEQEVRTLATFGTQAALAIQNRRFFQHLELLREITTTITQAGQLSQVLPIIADAARVILRADLAVICPYDAHHRQLTVDQAATIGQISEAHLRRRPKLDSTTQRLLAAPHGYLVVEDVNEAPWIADSDGFITDSFVKAERIRSYLGLVLQVKDVAVGVLYFDYREPRTFGEDEIRLARMFGNQAAVAIDNARLFDRLDRTVRDREAVQQLTAEALRHSDLDSILNSVVMTLRRVLHFDFVVISLVDGEAQTIRAVRSSGIPADWESALEFPLHVHDVRPYVVRSGETVIVKASEERFAPDIFQGAAAEPAVRILMPIQVEESNIGTVEAGYWLAQRAEIGEEEQEQLRAFVSQAALVIRRAQLAEATAQRSAQLRTLQEISQEINHAITSQAELREVLGLIAHRAALIADGAGVTIRRYTRDPSLHWIDEAHGGSDLPGSAVRTRVTHHVGDLALQRMQPVLASHQAGAEIGQRNTLSLPAETPALACYPLDKDMDTGQRVLLVEYPVAHVFRAIERETLQLFADQAAIAIHNAAKHRQLVEAFHLQTEGLFTASHELRSPVAYAKQVVANLLAGKLGPLSAKQLNRLQKLQGSLERQQRQIEHLLWISRLESHQEGETFSLEAQFEMRRISVTDLLKHAQQRITAPARDRQIKFTFKRPEHRGIVIWGDEHALNQVLDNLLENALKFTAAGGNVTLGCELHARRVSISVADTGIGISEESREHIFEKFYRAPVSAQQSLGGLGLGLYICRQLVHMHHGEIDVVGTPGGGATFIVTLPTA